MAGRIEAVRRIRADVAMEAAIGQAQPVGDLVFHDYAIPPIQALLAILDV